MNTPKRAVRGTAGVMLLSVLGLALARSATKPTLKLYVTNSEGDTITVIDLEELKVIGDIKVGDHVHDAAVEEDGRRLFTIIELEHTQKVIDTASYRVIETTQLTDRQNHFRLTPNG